MHEERWIVIPNWDRFQHPDVARNKHGAPPWIRLYVAVMNDDDFLGLSFHQRGVLFSIWVEYATSRRQLRDSTSTLSRRLGQRVTRKTLDALNDAGFLGFSASKPQADDQQPASPEERRGDLSPDQEPSVLPSVAKDPREPQLAGQNGRTDGEPALEKINPYEHLPARTA